MLKKNYQKKILIIDPNINTVMELQSEFFKMGIEVTHCVNISEALEVLKNDLPHMILLELILNEKNAFDFLIMRKNNKILKKVPLIVFTVNRNKDVLLKALQWGANDFLLKPVSITTLHNKLEKHFSDENSVYSKKFDMEDAPTLPVLVTSKIKKIGQVGLTLEGPFRVKNKNTVIQILCSLLTDNKVSYKQVAIDYESSFIKTGLYKTDFRFLGINEEDGQKLLQLIQEHSK